MWFVILVISVVLEKKNTKGFLYELESIISQRIDGKM